MENETNKLVLKWEEYLSISEYVCVLYIEGDTHHNNALIQQLKDLRNF